MSVSKLHAFRHQRESEYHKLLSVSEVTIVVEVWGEVVAVATFRVGTRLVRLATWSRLCCPLSFKKSSTNLSHDHLLVRFLVFCH